MPAPFLWRRFCLLPSFVGRFAQHAKAKTGQLMDRHRNCFLILGRDRKLAKFCDEKGLTKPRNLFVLERSF